jgi:hypothetical protein
MIPARHLRASRPVPLGAEGGLREKCDRMAHPVSPFPGLDGVARVSRGVNEKGRPVERPFGLLTPIRAELDVPD